MFPNLYSNCVYLLLVLFSHKENTDIQDDNLSRYNRDQLFAARNKRDVTNQNDHATCDDRISLFIERSVKKLIQRLTIISDNTTDLEINVKSRISLRHLNVLRHYLPQNYNDLNCEQLEEFEDSLDVVINSMTTGDEDNSVHPLTSFAEITSKYSTFFGYFSLLLFTYFTTKYLFQLLSRLTESRNFFSRRLVITLTSIVVILVSVVWKWRQKYLIELSRKQCYVLSTPEECLNPISSVTFMSWIRHYMYSYDQKRHNYYRSVTVDPFWEINPLTVMSELLAELVFTPLKPLGKYLGHFLSSLFGPIPLYLVIPVLIFVMFCTLLLLLLAAIWLLMPNSYTLSIPYLMSIQFERSLNHKKTIADTSDGQQSDVNKDDTSVKRYHIRANVVNVYHSLAPNDTKLGIDLTKNCIELDNNLTFETNEQIFLPFSEVD